MSRVFMKGCEAMAEAAVRAGCRFFAGYPITPQNEIPEYFARRMPEVGGTFLQGESEIASISMVYGAAAAGVRAMTSSSSPGISLKSEGISYCACAKIPMVYANIARGGPGVGSIKPAQMDYFQATKASGNGGFQMIVFAPCNVQESVDMTYKAFDLADKYRNPVLILSDGVVGAMMEGVTLPPMRTDEELEKISNEKKSWACIGHSLDEQRAWIEPGDWSTDNLERKNKEADAMYKSWQNHVAEAEEYLLDDAEYIIASYGISARVAYSVIKSLREEGFKVGMIRPKTVNPFPYKSFDNINYKKVKAILNVEMSIPAQFLTDVERAVKDRCPIQTSLCSGGNMISLNTVLEDTKSMISSYK